MALDVPDFLQVVLARKLEIQTRCREDANLAALGGAEGVSLQVRVVRRLDAAAGRRRAANVREQFLYGRINRRNATQRQQIHLLRTAGGVVLEDALLSQRTQDCPRLRLGRGQTELLIVDE